MFGQAASLQHVAKLLLAPATARLGCVPKRIHEFSSLCRHALGAAAHRLDLTGEKPELLTTVLLDLGNRLLVALQALVDGLEQRLEVGAGAFLRLAETLIGALEELFL